MWKSSPARSLLKAAQDECSAVTRNDLYNAIKRFRLAGGVEMAAASASPEALGVRSPAVQSSAVQSPAVIIVSVEDATQAVRDKKMGSRASAIACGLSKGSSTFRNRLHCLTTVLIRRDLGERTLRSNPKQTLRDRVMRGLGYGSHIERSVVSFRLTHLTPVY